MALFAIYSLSFFPSSSSLEDDDDDDDDEVRNAVLWPVPKKPEVKVDGLLCSIVRNITSRTAPVWRESIYIKHQIGQLYYVISGKRGGLRDATCVR